MLVLSRKPEEAIEFYRDGELLATVSLLKVRGDVARLGIEALKDIHVRRKELDRPRTLPVAAG